MSILSDDVLNLTLTLTQTLNLPSPGANFIFPEDWALYEAVIPANERDDYLKAYGKRLRGELGQEEKLKAAKAWSVWEGRTSKLVQDPWEKVKDRCALY